MRYPLLLLVLPAVQAFQLPFQLPKFFSTHVVSQPEEPLIPTTPRIAIVGAGAGGSSAAFWIAKAKGRFGLDVEIDVYESRDYIGGRSTTVYPYNNKSLVELELGASIFVQANKNLWRASDEFNLTRRNFEDQSYETGIWDGSNLLSFSGSWWDTAKLLWRYGFMSPRRTESFVREIVNQILVLYGPQTPKWDSVPGLSTLLGWTGLTNTTTLEYLTANQGISEKYAKEVVEAATRVNYGQNVDYIHALEGACALAGTGASAIAGGNFQIFEKFLNYSGANIYLNTPVTGILTSTSASEKWSVKTSSGSVDYKAVILAAPFHSTGITFPLSISDQVPETPYVHLHVTLLTTSSPYANSAYFGLSPGSPVPRMMLTTSQGGSAPEFNSLSYHGPIGNGEYAVKIFSDHEISDEWLANMFQGQVGWVLRKEWDAYPKLPPTSEFPPIKLDKGLYYVNSFETFISTMETETVSSRNIVDLMLNDEFNASICGRRIVATDAEDQEVPEKPLTQTTDPEFVYGWDC